MDLSLTPTNKASVPNSLSPSTASHVAFDLSKSGGLLALSIKPISSRPSNLNQPHTTFNSPDTFDFNATYATHFPRVFPHPRIDSHIPSQ